MPRLTDVFAAILSDLAAARKLADEQTVRLAAEYKKDAMLATMTVPRIRLPEVTIELPLVIESCDYLPPDEEADEPAGGARALPGAPASPAKATPQSFADAAGAALEQARGELTRRPGGVSTLEVMVSASDLKGRGAGVPITRLHLTLREEGLELVSADDNSKGGGRGLDGGPGFRLVPE